MTKLGEREAAVPQSGRRITVCQRLDGLDPQVHQGDDAQRSLVRLDQAPLCRARR